MQEGPGLVITRREGESIVADNNIKIQVLAISGNRVRIRVSALDGSMVPIDREEVFNQKGATHEQR